MTAAGRRLATIGLMALVAVAAASGTAQADLEIAPSDIDLEVLDAAGEPENRAGAHPDRLVLSIAIGAGAEVSEEVKDMVIDFPAGFGGDPRAVPQCPRAVFEGAVLGGGGCPEESQVGEAVIERSETSTLPIYSLEPGPDEAAVFGLAQTFVAVKLTGHLRAEDQGLSLALDNLLQGEAAAARSSRFEFWGVPADHQEGTAMPRRALLTTPTRCGAPIAVTVRARTWQQPSKWASATTATGKPLSGCPDLPFEPQVGLALSNSSIDSPTGVSLDVANPESDDPDKRAGSQLRRVSIALPEGMSLSPGVAAGLASCTDAQLGMGMESEAACPPSSRVGTVEVAAARLASPLSGGIYIGRELPGDRFRLFVVAEGPGTRVKLVGSLRPDPVTGRLTAVLEDLPQVSFGRMTMRFDGGPRALLATPLRCGPATAVGTFTPYSGAAPVSSSDAVAVHGLGGSNCPDAPPFAPGFVAGGSALGAGRPTSFSMTLSRRDGEQLPDRFDVALPPGFSAVLGSVKTCAAADAAAGHCAAASRIGSSLAEVGSGPNPAVLAGDVYLTGPYRRAPFGLVMTFPAKLGPFDLGSLIVRSALRLDPRSGQVSIQTDSLPRIVAGVPIRFQTIGLDLDRPGFMRNPTSCAPADVAATIRSTDGAVADAMSPFGLKGCSALRFDPSFSLALTKKAELHRDGKPGLEIEIQAPKGGANLRRADVRLPKALALDSSGIEELCARQEAFEGSCPAGARVGTASARSPLLDKRLAGSIFIAQPAGDGPPDLWTSLGGQGVELNLRSETVSEDGQLHAKLTDLPDMPLSALTMTFAAGRKGLFSLSHGLCAGGRPRRLSSAVDAAGQNGARLLIRAPVTAKPACAHSGARRADEGSADRRDARGA